MNVRLLKSASQDLIDGFDFYERQESGLGQHFITSLLSDIDSLETSAGIHSRIGAHYRALARRFPFAIYYKIADKVVLVDAILDCRRDPRTLDERLS